MQGINYFVSYCAGDHMGTEYAVPIQVFCKGRVNSPHPSLPLPKKRKNVYTGYVIKN